MSEFFLPVFALITVVSGLASKTDVYSAFIKGAKEGLVTAFSVSPYIAAMILASSLLTASGITEAISSFTGIAELLPLILIRPLSAGGSIGIVGGILSAKGADSTPGRFASVYSAGSETLFYNLSVYAGDIKETKSLIIKGLAVNLFTLTASLIAVKVFFG